MRSITPMLGHCCHFEQGMEKPMEDAAGEFLDEETNGLDCSSSRFNRFSMSRSTVVKKCCEFFQERPTRVANMQKRWSMCSPNDSKQLEDTHVRAASDPCPLMSPDLVAGIEQERREEQPRKWRSSMDIAMDKLRDEINSLTDQDNHLFLQLLSLHDTIVEIRERQHSFLSLCPDEEAEEEEEGDTDQSPSPSLESIFDPVTSPDSTLSSRSSHSASNVPVIPFRKKEPSQCERASTGGDSRPLTFVSSSDFCWRCRTGSKWVPPYRKSNSVCKLNCPDDDYHSYDSGIHLQGFHSDSDHEIFV